MRLKYHQILYIIIGSIFVIITAPSLFTDGMVMDGTFYAAMANNMANGLGSFWKPHLSNTFNSTFYGHPPLALWLQSIWFKVLGDSIYIERLYSLLTYVLIAASIIEIWKTICNTYKTSWIPLLFLFSIGKISWACANNMLENTMMLFICLSILSYLKSFTKHQLVYTLLSGLFLTLAILSKGLVSLYVWSFPFLFWILQRKHSFINMLIKSLILIATPLLILYLFYALNADAHAYMTKYINEQILGSINNNVTVDSRFFIIKAVIFHFLIPTLFAVLILLIGKIKKIELREITTLKLALTFLLFGLSGVFPLMISLKQSGHYAISTYPFIAIAIALIIKPIVDKLSEKMKIQPMFNSVFLYFAFSLFAVAIITSILQIGKYGYQKEIVHDCHTIIDVVGKDQVINICPNLSRDWYLYTYYARYAHISLDKNKNANNLFYLTKKDCQNQNLKLNYDLVDLETNEFLLFKRKQ